MHSEEQLMKRCLQLATRGRYDVFSNPMVGAVLVSNGEIISEGWHQKFGEEHAEVQAIKKIDQPSVLKESELWVNLEPCSHYGKTPPCVDLIVESNIPKVYIGMTDPNPLVAGNGIRRLENSGIEVKTSVLERECLALNRKFVNLHTRKMPYITLKWAESSDGYMGKKDERIQISGKESQVYVHRLRAENNCIMIGSKTANTDDPLLNVRLWSGHNPVKMILTGKTDLRQNLLILSDPETIVFSRQEKPLMAAAQTHTIKQADMLSGCLDYMAVSGYHSLLVEGGAAVLNSFINAGLWNEIHVIKSPTMLASGIPAPQLPLEAEEEQLLGKDKLSIFRNVL